MNRRGVTEQGYRHLVRIGGIADGLERRQSELRAEIEGARSEGASWREIGVALGTSTQSAWEKYRPQAPQSVTQDQLELDLERAVEDVPLPDSGFPDIGVCIEPGCCAPRPGEN